MASPGLAIGPAFHLRPPEVEVDPTGRGVTAETQALAEAIKSVKARIEARAESGGRQHRAILGAHLAFLDDPELAHAAHVLIGDGASAGAAWRGAVEGYVQMLRGLSDPRLAERVDDLIDLERQVLLALSGAADAAPDVPAGAILLADDLLPSQLMGLDAARLAGICTARGGPTSHVAILAAAMNLPAVVAAGAGVAAIPDGAPLILDADVGRLDISPDVSVLQAARSALEARTARRASARAGAHEDCRTADGVRIEVLANLASQASADTAVAAGAEGCGLLRTEFLFMERDQPPGEDEQLACYQAIADAMGARPLTIRTLDVGGDKPVGYLAIPAEDNPALGLRGVRVSLWRPDILKTQLRALLRVSDAGQSEDHGPHGRQPRRADGGEGDDRRGSRGVGGHPADPGGRHGRDSRRRGHQRPDLRRGGVHLPRHQRPGPVHPGDGPRKPAVGGRSRRLAPGRAAPDRPGGGGRDLDGPARQRLRRPGL